jgi:GT2 family glycosyltransferase
MKISVILVHYNAQQLLEGAILSFWKQELEVEWEFLITDNSQNFQETELKKLGIPIFKVDLGYNSGFARGVNQGLKNATGDIFFIVNQDAFLDSTNSVSELIVKVQSLPDKTILGCTLVDENNLFQQSVWLDDPGLKREWKRGAINCKLNPNWQIRMEEQKQKTHHQNGFVHRINGAFLVFKKPLNKIDILFDEDFFLYGEDIEWALRIKRIGWGFYHFKDVQVFHIGSASSSNESIKLAQIEIMDWLVLRKVSGKFFLRSYIYLLLFNKKLDLYLAGRKDKNSSEYVVCERRFAHLMQLKKNYLHLISKEKTIANYFQDLNLYK